MVHRCFELGETDAVRLLCDAFQPVQGDLFIVSAQLVDGRCGDNPKTPIVEYQRIG